MSEWKSGKCGVGPKVGYNWVRRLLFTTCRSFGTVTDSACFGTTAGGGLLGFGAERAPLFATPFFAFDGGELFVTPLAGFERCGLLDSEDSGSSLVDAGKKPTVAS